MEAVTKKTAATAERIIECISQLMLNVKGPSESECKQVVNIAMLILLYRASILANAINTKEYQRTEMVLVQWKTALKCVIAYRTVSTEAVCMLVGIPPIEIVADERKRVYSTTCWISWGSGKALQLRCNKRYVTLYNLEKRLSGSLKRDWIDLLIQNLKMWLERGYGQMEFYLTQVMSGHGAFNAYLFCMKLPESPKCANCDRKGRAYPVWVYGISTVLGRHDDGSARDGWGVSYTWQFGHNHAKECRKMRSGIAFVALTMHHKMEFA